MNINTTTYCIDKSRYNATKIAKTQIVIGTSLRQGRNYLTRILNRKLFNMKTVPAFTIGRDGTIFQHYKSEFHSEFLRNKNADIKSISIVLENMGALILANDGTYVNWVNEVCDEENVGIKKTQGFEYWEKFPNEQILALVWLCKEMSEKHGISAKCIEFNHYNANIVQFKGIAFRSNYIDDSSDINPLFEIEKFNEMLQS